MGAIDSCARPGEPGLSGSAGAHRRETLRGMAYTCKEHAGPFKMRLCVRRPLSPDSARVGSHRCSLGGAPASLSEQGR
jgi:hypothetical protein